MIISTAGSRKWGSNWILLKVESRSPGPSTLFRWYETKPRHEPLPQSVVPDSQAGYHSSAAIFGNRPTSQGPVFPPERSSAFLRSPDSSRRSRSVFLCRSRKCLFLQSCWIWLALIGPPPLSVPPPYFSRSLTFANLPHLPTLWKLSCSPASSYSILRGSDSHHLQHPSSLVVISSDGARLHSFRFRHPITSTSTIKTIGYHRKNHPLPTLHARETKNLSPSAPIQAAQFLADPRTVSPDRLERLRLGP